jgi:hypothetical protein
MTGTVSENLADDGTADKAGDDMPEIEALLPWYVAGTLRRRERRRVEQAFRNDAALAAHADLAREELAATIRDNEMLGAPSPRALERLMAALDGAAARKLVPGAATGWLTGFFASVQPRTLAVAASFAVLAIALQSFLIVDVFTRPHSDIPAYGVAAEHRGGTFAMVRFVRQASAAEITNFLQTYQATMVDGPTPAGLYRVKLAMRSLAKEELGRVVQRMRQDRVVEFAEADE